MEFIYGHAARVIVVPCEESPRASDAKTRWSEGEYPNFLHAGCLREGFLDPQRLYVPRGHKSQTTTLCWRKL